MMKIPFDRMTRRSFLALSAVAPLSALTPLHGTELHNFRYDHVIGTSMDLAVWTQESSTAASIAERARDTILAEIARLSAVLNTRDPESEISRFGEALCPGVSSDLRNVFEIYDRWERLTGRILSIRPTGPGSRLNVDALGKAYIIERAVKAASESVPGIDGLLLNVGGDIVLWGRAQEIAIADPRSPFDNAAPVTKILLQNRAIATSGSYARGNHLLDGRSGLPVATGVSATVIADDAVTANALATVLCIATLDEGHRLVQVTPGAEALRLDPSGFAWKTAGFARLEAPVTRPISLRTRSPVDWPSGFEISIALTVKEGQPAGGRGGRGGFGGAFGGRGGLKRPYVAVWVENATGKLVRVLAFWADKPRYYSELSSFFSAAGRDQNVLYSMARATRPPGSYQLLWDGMDDQRKPVPVGSYRIVVETNQEHGTYGKQSGSIECGDVPSMLSLPATANFDSVVVQYGPKQNRL